MTDYLPLVKRSFRGTSVTRCVLGQALTLKSFLQEHLWGHFTFILYMCVCIRGHNSWQTRIYPEYSNVEFSNSMPFSIFRLKSIVHNNNTSWIFRYWSSIDEVIREAVVLRGVKVRLLISFWKKTHPLTFNFVTSLKSLCVQLYNCSLEVVSESLTPVVLTTHGQVLIHTALMNYYFLLYMLFVKLLFFLAFF